MPPASLLSRFSLRPGNIPALPPNNPYPQGWVFQDYMYHRHTADGVFISIKEVGEIWAADSGEVIYEALPGVSEEVVRFFVNGSVLGIHLLRQGRFLLHGSTVVKAGRAIMFCGHSGAGKSTTTAYYLQQGYALVADDIGLVEFQDEELLVQPAFPQIKLWGDAVAALGKRVEDLPLLLPDWEKRRWEPEEDQLAGASPLTAIFILSATDCEKPSLRLLHGAERFMELAAHIYRANVVKALGKEAEHFAFCSRVAAAVPVYTLERPKDRFAMAEMKALIDAFYEEN